jgi:hypothetical protein
MNGRGRVRTVLAAVALVVPAVFVASAQPAAAAGMPVITAVTPDNGWEQGGETVVITGSNFTGTTAVKFWFFTAPALTVVDDSTLEVTVPNNFFGPGAVDLTVESSGFTCATEPFT